jgi:hypothetical protein
MADRTNLFMIVAYLAGLGALAYAWQNTPSPPPPPSEQAIEALPPLELPPVAINSIAVYDAITERPLFNAERRPNEVGASSTELANVAEPVDEIDGYRLAAVLKGYGSSTALIEDQSGNTRTLHPGEKLGKWELQEIQDDRVVLLSDARKETLLVHRFDPVVIKKSRNPVRRPSGRPLVRPPRRPPVALVPPGRELPISPKKPNP